MKKKGMYYNTLKSMIENMHVDKYVTRRDVSKYPNNIKAKMDVLILNGFVIKTLREDLLKKRYGKGILIKKSKMVYGTGFLYKLSERGDRLKRMFFVLEKEDPKIQCITIENFISIPNFKMYIGGN